MFITFSGLDGAGKSTLIASLKTALEKRNYRVTALTMYGQVSLYGIIRRVREQIIKIAGKAVSEKVAKDEFSSASKFSKDETPQYGPFQRLVVSVLRKNSIKRCVFVLDLFVLLIFRLYLEKIKNHIFILDRYFYDFLADVADENRWLYIRIFLLIAPTPDVPIFIDVSPENAFYRKGEYSVEHLKNRLQIYMHIFQWIEGVVSIPNNDLNQTMCRIEEVVMKKLKK